jgi:hypothetical protein
MSKVDNESLMDTDVLVPTKFTDWGLTDYQEAWDKQEDLLNKTVTVKTENRINSSNLPTPNHLIFCEHPHVYTLGKSGHPENLLLDEQGLKDKKATYYKINRGGDITYHGPGQIVGYPILDLDNFFTRYTFISENIRRSCYFNFKRLRHRIRALSGLHWSFGLMQIMKRPVKFVQWECVAVVGLLCMVLLLMLT